MGHLIARDVFVRVPGRALLEGVDLEARAGEFVAIVGPNGAGKTTLLRALAGIADGFSGSVVLDGEPPRCMTSARRARALALLAGESEEAGGLSVREAVMIGRYAHRPWWDWRRTDEDAAVVERALRRVALLGFADRPMRSLSSGERARALLALALAQGAQTLLLDEPTSHLDVRFAHEVLQLLRAIARRGATVVAVLHDLNEAAAYADRVAVLCEGRILCYAGPRASLDPQVLEMAYGMPFEPLETPRGYRVVAAHGATATLARDARPSF